MNGTENLIDVALGLTANMPNPDEVVTSGQTLYVASFMAEQAASDEKFNEKKDEIRISLVEEQKKVVQGSWLAFLRDRAEVEIDNSF